MHRSHLIFSFFNAGELVRIARNIWTVRSEECGVRSYSPPLRGSVVYDALCPALRCAPRGVNHGFARPALFFLKFRVYRR